MRLFIAAELPEEIEDALLDNRPVTAEALAVARKAKIPVVIAGNSSKTSCATLEKGTLLHLATVSGSARCRWQRARILQTSP